MDEMSSIEEQKLGLLEQAGSTLVMLKRQLRQCCKEGRSVKTSTVRMLCEKIEEQQKVFDNLDDELTVLENMPDFYFFYQNSQVEMSKILK